jgi:hypothetical protein
MTTSIANNSPETAQERAVPVSQCTKVRYAQHTCLGFSHDGANRNQCVFRERHSLGDDRLTADFHQCNLQWEEGEVL